MEVWLPYFKLLQVFSIFAQPKVPSSLQVLHIYTHKLSDLILLLHLPHVAAIIQSDYLPRVNPFIFIHLTFTCLHLDKWNQNYNDNYKLTFHYTSTRSNNRMARWDVVWIVTLHTHITMTMFTPYSTTAFIQLFGTLITASTYVLHEISSTLKLWFNVLYTPFAPAFAGASQSSTDSYRHGK